MIFYSFYIEQWAFFCIDYIKPFAEAKNRAVVTKKFLLSPFQKLLAGGLKSAIFLSISLLCTVMPVNGLNCVLRPCPCPMKHHFLQVKL